MSSIVIQQYYSSHILKICFLLFLINVFGVSCATREQTKTMFESDVRFLGALNLLDKQPLMFGTYVPRDQKKTLVVFFSSQCAPCKQHLWKLKPIIKENPNVRVILVNVSENAQQRSNSELVKMFIDQLNVNWSVILGTRKIIRAFGFVSAIPAEFLFDSKGNLMTAYRSEDGPMPTSETLQHWFNK